MDICFFNKNDKKLKDVMKIRYSVFTLEQGVPVEEDRDFYDSDENTVFCLVYDGEPAATGRLTKTESGFKIGRIATLKKYRGRGLGAVLVNALCEKAFESGAEYVNVEAQLHAIPFYEKQGFEIVSNEIIIDRNIEHKAMRKYYG